MVFIKNKIRQLRDAIKWKYFHTHTPAKLGAISAALAKAPAGVAPVIAKAAVYKAAGAAGSHPVYPKTNIRAAGGKCARLEK